MENNSRDKEPPLDFEETEEFEEFEENEEQEEDEELEKELEIKAKQMFEYFKMKAEFSDKEEEKEKLLESIKEDINNGYQEESVCNKLSNFIAKNAYNWSTYDRKLYNFTNELIISTIKDFLAYCFDNNKKAFGEKTICGLLEQNPEYMSEIITGCISICYLEPEFEDEIKIIQRIVSKFIFEFKRRNLIDKIYNTFTKRTLECQMENGDDFAGLTKLMKSFYNILADEPNNQILINLIKPSLLIFLSEYIERTLFFLENNNILSKHSRDFEFEEEALKALKEYKIISPFIESFNNIPLKSLLDEWSVFFNNKFQTEGIDGGCFSKIVLYIIKDFSKDGTIGSLFDDERLKNFYCANMSLNKIKKATLFVEESKKNNDIFVVYASTEAHSVVLLIREGTVQIIDSSLLFKEYKLKNFFNFKDYQGNGTCYLDAGIAFKILLDSINERPLEDTLKYLSEIGSNGQQNIINEVSKESVKLYELLGMAKNSTFVKEMDDTQPLSEKVRQLEIFLLDFVVKSGYLAKAFEELNYKVKCSNTDDEEISNAYFSEGEVYTNERATPCSQINIIKIVATKEQQVQQHPQEVLNKEPQGYIVEPQQGYGPRELTGYSGCYDMLSLSDMKITELYYSEMDEQNYYTMEQIQEENQEQQVQLNIRNEEGAQQDAQNENYPRNNAQQLMERRHIQHQNMFSSLSEDSSSTSNSNSMSFQY